MDDGRWTMDGYSGTPLVSKLGIKPGSRVYLSGAPKHYRALVSPLPATAKLISRLDKATDIVHVFATELSQLSSFLQSNLKKMRSDAAIWVSWPKKASKVSTDITEDRIRELALPLGLVDVKVCAVDDVWSGLKLVIRKENR
jgi:hypothetical protein